jgi:hypothetical protein
MVSAAPRSSSSALVPNGSFTVVHTGTAASTSMSRSNLQRRLRWTLTSLHAAAGVAALVGGLLLVSDPTGARLHLATRDLHGFESFLIPGVLLAILGLVQLGVAAWTTKPGAAPMTASHWSGAAMVLFIAFQSALLEPLLTVAAVFLFVGLVIYTISHELHRQEPHEPWLP